MKNIILLLLLVSSVAVAQTKYLTKTGELTFEASVPSFEEVKATNSAVTAIFNEANGEFAALALVKGFRFKNALMEEHFNENYAESDDYPKATFKGTITNLEASGKTTINGQLTFHGQSKSYENIAIVVKRDGDKINISGEFTAHVSDFNIKIPKVVSNKLSEDVQISFVFSLAKR